MTNPTIDCLLNHRSIRKFKDQPIEPDKLELILRAGTRAATAGNLQLYTLIAVDDEAKKKELDGAWGPKAIMISESAVAVIALADQYRVKRWLQLHSDFEIHNNYPINFFLAVWDALIALQNVVVASESLGLGTCYIGSILSMDVQSLLNVPEHVFPVGLVCIGYPDQEKDLSMRLPLEAVVHKNKYQVPSDMQIMEWYAERDKVWDTVPYERKQKLSKDGLFGIAQALSVQRYSKKIAVERSEGILENLKKSGFNLS